MEIIDNTDTDSDFVHIMKMHLLGTAKWGRRIAFMIFTVITFVIVIAIALGIDFSDRQALSVEDIEALKVFAVYATFALLGLIPAVYLSKFSNGAIRHIETLNLDGILHALFNLKKSFTYLGILIICIIVFHVLLIWYLGF